MATEPESRALAGAVIILTTRHAGTGPHNNVPIQSASSLDCDGIEKLGLLRIPPMEPLVAAHLLPRMGPSPSRNPTLPAKSDRFQSTMTERSYKAAALSARALNVS
ncbi:hypothetical protein CgunFtcFv8_019841 [Champsocephalus gunnari]|uniref:Uncharacterized protein n=1 Tax=Champsocephalus gunnari TaxID=52237 RepID=A0AAN8DIM4_CHAGU|nr:hypothetical protein CgunFtcFv8_019841 [Champsocephalus gunnari]